MQLIILCTCLSLCLTPDAKLHCALTLFAILQGKVVTFLKVVGNITCMIFLEI